MYAPINIPVYVASYSGAIAGMGISGWIVDPVQNHYELATKIAGSFAQAFDVAWNSATQLNNLELASITAIVSTQFAERGPGPLENPVFQTVANWDQSARAAIALVLESDVYFAGQGINPGTPGGGGLDILVKVSAADTTAEFLQQKLTSSSSSGVSFNIINPGANERLEISTNLSSNEISDNSPVGGPSVEDSLTTLLGMVQPSITESIVVATPALVAGVMGYVNVDLSLSTLAPVAVGDPLVAQPTADLVPGGATQGYYIGLRVSAPNTARLTFVGTLPGGGVAFNFTKF